MKTISKKGQAYKAVIYILLAVILFILLMAALYFTVFQNALPK